MRSPRCMRAPACTPNVVQDARGGETLLQIMIRGQDDQGAQTAATFQSSAFFAEWKQVQCFFSDGGTCNVSNCMVKDLCFAVRADR